MDTRTEAVAAYCCCCGVPMPAHWAALWSADPFDCRCLRCEGHTTPCRAYVIEVEERAAVLLDELHGFALWAHSYPTNVWIPPDADSLKAAHAALKDAGLGGIDALSAQVYRHALENIGERAMRHLPQDVQEAFRHE